MLASVWLSLYVWVPSKRVFVSVIAQLRLLSQRHGLRYKPVLLYRSRNRHDYDGHHYN